MDVIALIIFHILLILGRVVQVKGIDIEHSGLRGRHVIHGESYISLDLQDVRPLQQSQALITNQS